MLYPFRSARLQIQPTQPVRSLVRIELPAGDLVVVVRPATRGRDGEVALWYAAYDAPKVRTLLRIPGAPAVPLKPVWPGELIARLNSSVLRGAGRYYGAG